MGAPDTANVFGDADGFADPNIVRSLLIPQSRANRRSDTAAPQCLNSHRDASIQQSRRSVITHQLF
jgi:hypothetical protein